MAVDVISLFRNHFLREHGVINVRAVITDLIADKTNPVSALKQVLDDFDAADWHFYAAEGLRSLAAQGLLNSDDARKLLEATRPLYQQLGLDEYYKSLTALASSDRTAPLLVEFAEERLVRRDLRDWRWLAFFAAGTLLEQVPSALTRHLVGQLDKEVPNEPDPRRKAQMQDVAVRCFRATA